LKRKFIKEYVTKILYCCGSASETWVNRKRDISRIQTAQIGILRIFKGVRRDKLRSVDIRTELKGMESVKTF
jgi:hypothetical protein